MAFNTVFSFIYRSFLYIGIFIFLLLVIPGIPPNIKFESYKVQTPRKLEGILAPNSILDKAVALYTDEFAGPESIAQRNENELYSGTLGGKVIQIKNGKVKTIARFGQECEGTWDEEICGRPLALRFNPSNGKLIVMDGYYGIFELDVDTGKYETILQIGDMIEKNKLTFPDDLDVAKDGTIYFSDVSTYAPIDHMVLEILGQPSGRLIQIDRKNKEHKVLMDKIHFSNGVQLSKDEDFILLSETVRLRVWRLYLKGPKKGQKDIFIENLPGMPDNIRPNGKGGFYIALVGPRIHEPSIGEILGPLPYARKVVLRVQSIILFFLSGFNTVLPNQQIIKQAIHYVKNLGPMLDLKNMPKKVIIIETDGDGNILRSLQNDKNGMSTVTEVSVGEKYTYFGSVSMNKLWRMDNKDLK